jgi:hypothetical protein
MFLQFDSDQNRLLSFGEFKNAVMQNQMLVNQFWFATLQTPTQVSSDARA